MSLLLVNGINSKIYDNSSKIANTYFYTKSNNKLVNKVMKSGLDNANLDKMIKLETVFDSMYEEPLFQGKVSEICELIKLNKTKIKENESQLTIINRKLKSLREIGRILIIFILTTIVVELVKEVVIYFKF